jgi:hypothetical protein
MGLGSSPCWPDIIITRALPTLLDEKSVIKNAGIDRPWADFPNGSNLTLGESEIARTCCMASSYKLAQAGLKSAKNVNPSDSDKLQHRRITAADERSRGAIHAHFEVGSRVDVADWFLLSIKAGITAAYP